MPAAHPKPAPPLLTGTSPPPACVVHNCGWQKEALSARERREENRAAMDAFVALFEACEVGAGDHGLLCLALHQLAMGFGSFGGRKKTLQRALKAAGGIRKLSEVAPAIFPPDRVPRR